MKIEAPWTVEQTVALNAWQRCGHVHPFTCGAGDRHDAIHMLAKYTFGGEFWRAARHAEWLVLPARLRLPPELGARFHAGRPAENCRPRASI